MFLLFNNGKISYSYTAASASNTVSLILITPLFWLFERSLSIYVHAPQRCASSNCTLLPFLPLYSSSLSVCHYCSVKPWLLSALAILLCCTLHDVQTKQPNHQRMISQSMQHPVASYASVSSTSWTSSLAATPQMTPRMTPQITSQLEPQPNPSSNRLVAPATFHHLPLPSAPAKRRRPTFWDTVLNEQLLDSQHSQQLQVQQQDHHLPGHPTVSSPVLSVLTSSGRSPSPDEFDIDGKQAVSTHNALGVTGADRLKLKKGIDKMHECEICHSRFARSSHLRLHVRTIHEKLKPFQCDECDARFGHVSSKYRHYRTVHLKRRDFSCDRCGQTFAERSAVLKHCRTVHEGCRPYPCSICGFRFHFKLHLAQHVATVHDKLRPHRCSICNSSFGQRSSLNRHIRQIHGIATKVDGTGVKNENGGCNDGESRLK